MLIKELNNLEYKSKILLLSSFADEEMIMKVNQLGVIGYLMKDIEPNDLVNANKLARQGSPHINTILKTILK